MLRNDVFGQFESLRVNFISHQVIFLIEQNIKQSTINIIGNRSSLINPSKCNFNIILQLLIDSQMHKQKKDAAGPLPLDQTSQYEELINGLIHDDGHDHTRIKSMYKYPASRKEALMHRKANQFGYNSKTAKDGTPVPVCPCCSLPINTVRIKMKYGTTPTRQHVKSGGHIFLLNAGSAMFFTFIKMAVAYLILRFILTDGYNLISNLTGRSCNQQENSLSCKANIMSRFSTYNKGTSADQPMVYVVDILNLVTVVLSMVFFMLYRRYQHEVYSIADISSHSQIDYSVFVENIPIFLPNQDSIDRQSIGLKCKYEEELKKLFQEHLNKWIAQVKETEGKSNKLSQQFYKLLKQNPKIQTDPKIMSISLCFDLTEMEKLNEIRDELMTYHKKNIEKGVEDDANSILYLPNQIECLNEEYMNLSKKFAADNTVSFNLSHFVGKAFICFEYQHYREYFLQYMNKIPYLSINGEPLKISSPSEPTDVYWFNMKISNQARRYQIIVSFIIMFLSLGLSFVLLFKIQLYKSAIAAKKSQIQTSKEQFFSYFFTILMTVLTIAINFVLAMAIEKLTVRQRHKTKTDFIFSLMVKTVLAQFVNTAVIYYVISLGDQRDLPLSDNGLVMNVTSLVAVSGAIQIVLNLLQPGTIFSNVMNWWKYSEDSVNMFQVQLNNTLQDPEFNFSSQYAYYIVNVYIVSFYSYITPYISIVLAIIFCIQYWVDKYNLFQRFSCPTDFDFKLSRFTLKAFECSIFVFALGNLLFSIDIHTTKEESEYHIINWVSFGLAAAYCLAIMLLPKRWFQSLDEEDYEKTPYSWCLQNKFFTKVYWLSNPGTAFAKEDDLNNKGQYIEYGTTEKFATATDFENIVEAQKKGEYKIETYTSQQAQNIGNALNVLVQNQLAGGNLNGQESFFSKIEDAAYK